MRFEEGARAMDLQIQGVVAAVAGGNPTSTTTTSSSSTGATTSNTSGAASSTAATTSSYISGTSSWRPPTVCQLRSLAVSLRGELWFKLLSTTQQPAGRSEAAGQLIGVARQQVELEPGWPSSHHCLANALVVGRQAEEAARHFQRGLKRAREQGSDVWTALLACELATWAALRELASVTPHTAAALLDEATAAHLRCGCLPADWVQSGPSLSAGAPSVSAQRRRAARREAGGPGRAGQAGQRRGRLGPTASEP